jgi:protein-S-isoprenylcysteine O-methyltransferase Ste14
MSLRDRWITLIYEVATRRRRVWRFLTPASGVLFMAIVAFVVIAVLRIDSLLGFPRFLTTPLNVILAVPLLGAGLFLWLRSVAHFARMKGTPVPFSPPPRLVTSGPYAHTRNPMLAGIFLVLFGIGFLFGSISLVVIFTPLSVLVTVIGLKTIEEPELEKRLGKAYTKYKASVPMFIPRARKP